MKKIFLTYAALFCFVISAGIHAGGEPADAYRISGPYTHKNLSLFLIHGKNTINAKKFLTLAEAMEQKKATVHETDNVNQLTITNSSHFNIFIMSGDIVKGGKQDRVIQYNYIVPPGIKRMPISSFCVESGRWQQRGNEKADRFSTSQEMIATKDLKMSVKKGKSQSEVWSKVTEVQNDLEKNLGGPVRGTSASSLQLTLENKKLVAAQKEYRKALAGILRDEKDVVGYACVINGTINSAEVFASDILFKKLWAKLVNSSIVEAVAKNPGDTAFQTKTAKDVKKFMVESEKAATVTAQEVNRRTKIVEKEADDRLYYETRDADNRGQWINKSYLMK